MYTKRGPYKTHAPKRASRTTPPRPTYAAFALNPLAFFDGGT